MIARTIIAAALSCAALGACAKKSDAPAAAKDNTQRNKNDVVVNKPTADETGQSSSDVDTTKKIRMSVTEDGSLSTNAHNAKIVVQDGKVTLVGPVASEAERTKLAQLAADVVGEANVVNQLEVKD